MKNQALNKPGGLVPALTCVTLCYIVHLNGSLDLDSQHAHSALPCDIIPQHHLHDTHEWSGSSISVNLVHTHQEPA